MASKSHLGEARQKSPEDQRRGSSLRSLVQRQAPPSDRPEGLWRTGDGVQTQKRGGPSEVPPRHGHFGGRGRDRLEERQDLHQRRQDQKSPWQRDQQRHPQVSGGRQKALSQHGQSEKGTGERRGPHELGIGGSVERQHPRSRGDGPPLRPRVPDRRGVEGA